LPRHIGKTTHFCNSEGSPALGKFYVVTDGGYRNFWEVIDSAVTAMGFPTLWDKTKLPYAFMMFVAYICNVLVSN
jgi:hypothetical protein